MMMEMGGTGERRLGSAASQTRRDSTFSCGGQIGLPRRGWTEATSLHEARTFSTWYTFATFHIQSINGSQLS